MTIPTPPDLARGRVSWTIGRAPSGTALPGARGTVLCEPTAVAVTYSTATVLPEPVEAEVVAGVMAPVDLLQNDPEVWNWRITPKLGVRWEPFHIDVDGPVNLATAAVVPGKGPIRAVKGEKGDPGKDGATPYESGLRDITSLVTTRTAGTLHVQRYGRLIFLMAYGLVCSDQASGFIPVTLPDGFRPPRTLIDTSPLHITGTTTGQRTLLSAAGPVTFYGVTAGTGIYLSTTYLTPNNPPAIPPGSPA